MARTDILEQREQILEWIDNGESKAFMCKELHCKPETLNNYLMKMGIEYKGNQSGKGKVKIGSGNRYMPLIEYLLQSQDIQTNKIRAKLLREGYKEHICESCGLTEWME